MQFDLCTPFGILILTWEEGRLSGIRFGPYVQDRILRGVRPRRCQSAGRDLGLLLGELNRYFSGVPTAFTVPVRLENHTDFQRAVWKAICAVPYGCTTTYGRLAEGLGDRGAARAVGAALGQNPFPVLIPCHRAIGADGSLTGFGGGLDWKRALLSLESGQTEMF